MATYVKRQLVWAEQFTDCVNSKLEGLKRLGSSPADRIRFSFTIAPGVRSTITLGDWVINDGERIYICSNDVFGFIYKKTWGG